MSGSRRSARRMAVALAVAALLGGGLASAGAADGPMRPASWPTGSTASDNSAWLSGVDVSLVRDRHDRAALAVTLFGAPGARVMVHLAGREPLVLRAGGNGLTPQGETAYHGLIEPTHRLGTPEAALPERFIVQLQVGAQGTAAVVERPPAGDGTAVPATVRAEPRIARVALAPEGAVSPHLTLQGTPGAQAMAWVPGADGQLDIVPLVEHTPGRYIADLPAGCQPMAVELAMGRQVATWSLESSLRMASVSTSRDRAPTRR